MELYEKYPSAARSELRSDLVMPTLFISLGALVFGGEAAVNGTGWTRVVGVGGGAALLLFAHSLWHLRNWARWMLVALIGAGVGSSLVNRLFITRPASTPEWIVFAIGVVFWGSVLAYLASSGVSRMMELANSEWSPRAGRAESEELPAPDRDLSSSR